MSHTIWRYVYDPVHMNFTSLAPLVRSLPSNWELNTNFMWLPTWFTSYP